MSTGSGFLGSADLAAATNTPVWTAPSTVQATVDISFCVRTAGATAQVRVAIGSGSSPANADYLMYDETISGHGGVYGVPVSPGEKVWVQSNVSGVNAVVRGAVEAVYAV